MQMECSHSKGFSKMNEAYMNEVTDVNCNLYSFKSVQSFSVKHIACF